MAAIRQRLDEFYRRLGALPRASSAEDALEEISRTLDQVEDDLSGITKKVPPPPKNVRDGRMYPPQADSITRHANGTIVAGTRGQIIEIGTDGSVTIRNRFTGAVEFQK